MLKKTSGAPFLSCSYQQSSKSMLATQESFRAFKAICVHVKPKAAVFPAREEDKKEEEEEERRKKNCSTGVIQDLHSAGLTHVHLLPSYDFGSVPEKSDDQKLPEASKTAQDNTESGLDIPPHTELHLHVHIHCKHDLLKVTSYRNTYVGS